MKWLKLMRKCETKICAQKSSLSGTPYRRGHLRKYLDYDIFRPGEPSVKNEHRFFRRDGQGAVIHPLAEILNKFIMTFIA